MKTVARVFPGKGTTRPRRSAHRCRAVWSGIITALLATFAARAALIQVFDSSVAGSQHWYGTNTYVLNGYIHIGDGGILNIEAGTVIKGSSNAWQGEPAALIVTSGGKIYARGEATNPIIFTAERDDVGNPSDLPPFTRGLWGGVILMGRAPINTAADANGDQASPKYDVHEGFPDTSSNGQFVHRYGGDDENDSSGELRYVSIRHGGAVLAGGREINGLTLCAVGRGTRIEFVESFSNLDDGFEFFGGTVNTRYLVSAFNGDDAFDVDQGYRGKNQFWFAIQEPGARDKGAEINGEPTGLRVGNPPLSVWEVWNATWIGAGAGSGSGNNAFTIREAASPRVLNSIFTDFAGRGLSIDASSGAHLTNGLLDFRNNFWFGYTGGTTPDSATNLAITPQALGLFTDATRSNRIVNPQLRSISRTNNGALDPRLAANSPALTAALLSTDSFYCPVAWIGAFGSENWAAGWTALARYEYMTGPGAPPLDCVPKIRINEWMAANTATLPDEDGAYSDWIELYNPGPGTVNLQGFCLTDTNALPCQWRFPERLLPAGGFLIVFASGKDRTNAAGPLHASFTLAQSGETIGLYSPEGGSVDFVIFDAQSADASRGRFPDGAGYTEAMRTPTPGTNNVATPPFITFHPSPQTVLRGGMAGFQVGTLGTQPLSHQWSFGGQAIPFGTNTTLILTNVQPHQAGRYLVVASNVAGTASSTNALLTVHYAPVLNSQPQSVTVPAGSNANFSVAASAGPPPTYQWRMNGTNLLGATNDTFTIVGAHPIHQGSYTVVIANFLGIVTSAVATLTVLVPPTPVITSQPRDITVRAGLNANFSVLAAGNEPLSYQWSVGGSPIPGATTATLSLANVQTNASGGYSVVVANPAGSATSRVALLTVTLPPVVVLQPQSQTVEAGHDATFWVEATGTTPISFRWRRFSATITNGIIVSTPTSSTLTMTNVQFTDNDARITVVLTNVANVLPGILSAAAVLTVVADTNRPMLLTAVAGTDLTRVRLTFSERIDPASVSTVSNYTLRPIGGGASLAISSAVLSSPSNVLVTAAALQPGTRYEIAANGIRDLAGNGLPPDIFVECAVFLPTPGVGLGVGVGSGIGLDGNTIIRRVPALAVDGRRVFAAPFRVSSSQTLPFAFRTVAASSSGSDNMPHGNSHAWTANRLRSATTESCQTTVTVFNPNTNSVSFSRRTIANGGGVAGVASLTLAPCQSLQFQPDLPPASGGPWSGMLLLESAEPLEVVAFYQYNVRELVDAVVRELHEECVCNPDSHSVPSIYQ